MTKKGLSNRLNTGICCKEDFEMQLSQTASHSQQLRGLQTTSRTRDQGSKWRNYERCSYMRRSTPCLRPACLRLTLSSIQFYTASTVLPLESVVFVLACIMMAAGNPSNGRCPATYFYSSTSGLVGIWLSDHYLKLMNNCVR